MNNYNNFQQLNITTLLDNKYNEENKLNKYNYNGNTHNGNTHNGLTQNENIMAMNTIFKNNVSDKYEIKQYLGEGIQGSLYIAFDKKNKKYICKKINLNRTLNPTQEKQLNFELNLLKYLSSNKVTREYINPCLEHKLVDNQVFTIFPIFNGFSLNHIKEYLLKLNHKHYYKILFHLIKIILHGLAKIHQHNIAHQNINGNSILVSTYGNTDSIYMNGIDTNSNIDEIKVKFTDFGLGCGVNNNFITDVFYDINKCNSKTVNNTAMPIKITNSIVKELSKSDYLSIAQKTDIILLCTLFIQLLLFFENIELDISQGYNETLRKQIKQIITEKFLSKIETYRKNKFKSKDDVFVFLNTPNETKRDILEYLNIFNDYVLCEDQDRQSCQYILDKLIIYEKYKNEVF
jgi:serine/threonine protein kinase